MNRLCQWPGCEVQIPSGMWGCKYHWFKLPKHLRKRLYLAYAPKPQVITVPSPEYVKVMQDIADWLVDYVE